MLPTSLLPRCLRGNPSLAFLPHALFNRCGIVVTPLRCARGIPMFWWCDYSIRVAGKTPESVWPSFPLTTRFFSSFNLPPYSLRPLLCVLVSPRSIVLRSLGVSGRRTGQFPCGYFRNEQASSDRRTGVATGLWTSQTKLTTKRTRTCGACTDCNRNQTKVMVMNGIATDLDRGMCTDKRSSSVQVRFSLTAVGIRELTRYFLSCG